MSHRAQRVMFFIRVSFTVVSAVLAQQPNTGVSPEVQPGQPQPQANQTPPAETSSQADHSSPSPRPAESGPASLPAIHVTAGPSADILRSARDAGFKIKMVNNTTHFCKSEAKIGTHLASESCMNADQLTVFLTRVQFQRDQLEHMLGAPYNAGQK